MKLSNSEDETVEVTKNLSGPISQLCMIDADTVFCNQMSGEQVFFRVEGNAINHLMKLDSKLRRVRKVLYQKEKNLLTVLTRKGEIFVMGQPEK